MYDVRIETDSVSPAGVRLTTMVVTLPRNMLAELNTHRMLSRNSASNRAIPVRRQLDRIKADPFVPVHWGKNQSGMQAEQELDEAGRDAALEAWLAAGEAMMTYVERLLAIGLHKQVANRLLEPFMWQTVAVTATEWDNFFALRANAQAQPEIRTAAEMMLQAYRDSTPMLLSEGQWHLPFILPEERDGAWELTIEAAMVSAARCARVSYLTHDGRRDLAEDLGLYRRLTASGHMSPLEHVARPFTAVELEVRTSLDAHARQLCESHGLDELVMRQLVEATAFNGNFRGWTQLRKTMLHEDNFGLLQQA